MNSPCFDEGTLGIDTSAGSSVQSCGRYSASIVRPTNRIQSKEQRTHAGTFDLSWALLARIHFALVLILDCDTTIGFSSTHVSVSLEWRPQALTHKSKDTSNFLSFLLNISVKQRMLDEVPKIFWTSRENVFLGKHRRSRIWHIFDNLMTNSRFVHRDLLKWNGYYKSIVYISYEFYLVKHWPISYKFYFLCHFHGSEQRYCCCLDCLLCFPLFTALLNRITGEGILTVPQIVEKFHFSVLENHQEEKGNFSPEACEA